MTRTLLELVGEIPLPAHQGPGGFDHAAVHRPRRQLYVAHTANNALDVIDCESNKYLRSVPAANVGDPAIPGSFTVSVVDVSARSMIADVPVSGRTRWTVFDADAGCFYVNIDRPAQIVVIDSASPDRVARAFHVAAAGPHGMDLDAATHRLFCACDAGTLVVLDAGSGLERARAELAGAPDVIFFNRERRHLYVAIGDPGLIEVFETDRMRRIETIRTEPGAHTLGFDQARDLVYAFLPGSHRALVLHDHD